MSSRAQAPTSRFDSCLTTMRWTSYQLVSLSFPCNGAVSRVINARVRIHPSIAPKLTSPCIERVTRQARMQHFLYLRPLPHGQGSLRPIGAPGLRIGWGLNRSSSAPRSARTYRPSVAPPAREAPNQPRDRLRRRSQPFEASLRDSHRDSAELVANLDRIRVELQHCVTGKAGFAPRAIRHSRLGKDTRHPLRTYPGVVEKSWVAIRVLVPFLPLRCSFVKESLRFPKLRPNNLRLRLKAAQRGSRIRWPG